MIDRLPLPSEQEAIDKEADERRRIIETPLTELIDDTARGDDDVVTVPTGCDVDWLTAGERFTIEHGPGEVERINPRRVTSSTGPK